MRVKTLVLGSASLTILALAASPAFAQGNQGNGDAANPPISFFHPCNHAYE